MKPYKFLTLLLVSLTILFTSCDRNSIDEVIEESTKVEDKVQNGLITATENGNDGLGLDCFTITFPFQMVTINDNIIDLTSQEDVNNNFADSIDYVVDFVYPLTLVDEEGETVVVDNIDELGEAFVSCVPDNGWSEESFPAFYFGEEHCVSLAFPVNLLDIDGNTLTVANEAGFVDAMALNEALFFSFPIMVTDNTTGETYEVISEEELLSSITNCDGTSQPGDTVIWGGSIMCLDIILPVTFNLADGTTITAEDEDELVSIQISEEIVSFVYPVNLLDTESGELLTVTDEEELGQALESCFMIFITGIPPSILLVSENYCYTINYPITMESIYGDVIEISSSFELANYVNYPFFITSDVILTLLDGTQVTVTSVEELAEIVDNC